MPEVSYQSVTALLESASSGSQEALDALFPIVYRVIGEIAEGGMGVVYRGLRDDNEYTQEVAIKVVGGVFASKAHLERFRIERQILANLNHPRIARLLDGGTTPEGLPFLVMELITGEPINDYCNRRRLSVRFARRRCAAEPRGSDACLYSH